MIGNGYIGYGQSDEPLKSLEFYIGRWGLSKEDPMVQKRPQLADLRVIDFEWGDGRQLIRSKTGIYGKEQKIPFSEGIITYNPLSEKLVWVEYQFYNKILFEGEYVPLTDGKVQRVYTVYYAEGYDAIPLPELEGWTRKFRETFIPTSDDTIDWVTEVFIGDKWVKHGQSGGETKAIRIN